MKDTILRFKKEDFDGSYTNQYDCSATRCLKRYSPDIQGTYIYNKCVIGYKIDNYEFKQIIKLDLKWGANKHNLGKKYYKFRLNKIFGDITKKVKIL